MSGNQWTRYGLIGLIFIFAAVPGRHGFMDGTPFENPWELIGLLTLLFACILLPLGDIQHTKKRKKVGLLGLALIAVTAAKIMLGTASLPHGLMGEYRSSENTTATYERSTDAPPKGLAGTHLDPVIAFENKGYSTESAPLPVWFFNDSERFNQKDLDRTLLPFNVQWNGYMRIQGTTAGINFDHDGDATFTIDGVPYDTFVAWKSGIYPVRIEYTPSKSRTHFLRITEKASKKVFTDFFPKKYDEVIIDRDRIIGWLSFLTTILGLCASAILIYILLKDAPWKEWRATEKPWMLAGALACFGILAAQIFIAAQSPYFNTLFAGSDELTYETFARHMRLTGDWSMASLEREAYYYQLYYYFLAAMHYAGGEGLIGVFLIQAMVLVCGACLMARGISNEKNKGLMIAAIAIIALMPKLAEETMHLMPTVMGIFFAGAVAALLTGIDQNKTRKTAPYCLAGVALGLGILNRYNFMAWTPILALYIYITANGRRISATGAFITGVMIVLALPIARNGIVAHQWRLVSQSNTTANFLLGTSIPQSFAPQSTFRAETTPIIRILFDERVNLAIEWIRERPREYLELLATKARRALLYSPILWALFPLASVAWLLPPALIPAKRAEYLIYGGFIISQFATITLFSTGNERYYLTLIPFLVLIALLFAMTCYRSINSLFHNSKQIKSQIR